MRDIYLLQMSRAFHSRIIVNFIPFLHIFYTIWLTVKHFYISSQLFSTSYVITKMDMKLIGYRGAWSCNFSFEYCVTFPSHTHARARTNQRYLEWRINHLRVERPKMLVTSFESRANASDSFLGSWSPRTCDFKSTTPQSYKKTN